MDGGMAMAAECGVTGVCGQSVLSGGVVGTVVVTLVITDSTVATESTRSFYSRVVVPLYTLVQTVNPL